MTKPATDNVACINCGADVRGEALFCYNCGGAVALSSEADALPEIPEPKDEPVPISDEADKLTADVPAKKHAGVKEPKKPLTAAMLRRKRAYNRQPVEIVWKEPETHSRVFIVASVVLTLLAAVILAAAFYLK